MTLQRTLKRREKRKRAAARKAQRQREGPGPDLSALTEICKRYHLPMLVERLEHQSVLYARFKRTDQ